MKVALINGQNHKGSSYNTGKVLALKLTNEEDIFEIFLPKDFDKYCMGCNSCFMKSERLCPHYNLIHPIDEIMKKCDVLIFTTPTYVFHMSGQLKGFLDHFGYRWIVHRPEAIMFKKQAVCISTAAGMGTKKAVKGIKDSLFFWGVSKIYTLGINVYSVTWNDVSEKVKEKIDKKTDKTARKILKNVGKTKPTIKTKLWFYGVRMLQKKGGLNKVDNEYWNMKGYIKDKRPWL